MKSSPFKLFSLSAREADQRGNYANPELGRYKATTFDHPDLSGIENKKAKPTPEDMGYDGTKPSIKPKGLNIEPSKIKPVNIPTSIVKERQIIRTKGTPRVTEEQAWNRRDKVKYPEGSRDQFNKDMRGSSLYGTSGSKGKSILKERTIATIGRTNVTGNWKESNVSDDPQNKIAYDSNSVSQMKGSPVKHNAGAAGAIGSDFSQAKNQYADIFSKSATTVGQNKQSGVGALQSFITRAKNQGGSMVGSISQQIGNEAQQRAADAGGSTSVDPFLPPPNQVAETGSYGGGGDRILEMDSNPVGNQSIGRDTDVASQLFGSGQRASMLAMKGTPLHTEGHGGAEGHTHAKPGDYLDQTVAENKGVNDIENYKPIQKFKGKQIVVNPSTNDSIFSTNRTFVIPKQMEGITRSPEGTPKYKPVYINKKSN